MFKIIGTMYKAGWSGSVFSDHCDEQSVYKKNKGGTLNSAVFSVINPQLQDIE